MSQARAYLRGRAALLVFVAAVGFATQTAATSIDAARSAIRIDNFGQVNSRYYRGGQPDGRDYADLAALGVKTIVNLTSDDAQADEPTRAAQHGMRYVHIPMTTHRPPTAAQLSQFLTIIDDPVNQPVYVHCVGGRHRTGVMTAVYRMTRDRWTADQAFAEMKKYRFGADFLHAEFKEFVYGFGPDAARATSTVIATQIPKP
jgi:protein tyrosine/serine phosphatase